MAEKPLEIIEVDEKKLAELESEHKFLKSPKFQKFIELYHDASNKETYGNGTRSALIAYNLDEKTQYNSAAAMANENLKKLKGSSAKLLEAMGITENKLLQIAVNNMVKTRSPVWFNHVLKLANKGHLKIDDIGTQGTTVNIQNNVQQIEATAEKREEYNEEFRKFLEQRKG